MVPRSVDVRGGSIIVRLPPPLELPVEPRCLIGPEAAWEEASACASHPACAADVGDCCPTPQGAFLDCCSPWGDPSDRWISVPAVVQPKGVSVLCEAPAAESLAPSTVSVLLGDGTGLVRAAAAALIYYVAGEAPTLSAVHPRSALRGVPELLHVLGLNFAPLSSLFCDFGAEGRTAATFASATALKCQSPPATGDDETETVPLTVVLRPEPASPGGEVRAKLREQP